MMAMGFDKGDKPNSHFHLDYGCCWEQSWEELYLYDKLDLRVSREPHEM